MGRRNDHSREQIREMALNAVSTLLEREGINALSTRKIANEIGYTVGTLYLVFRNLDDLIIQVNLRTLCAMRETLLTATSGVHDPIMKLKSMASAYIQFARTHEPQWRLVYERSLSDDASALNEYQQITTSLLSHLEVIMSHAGTLERGHIALHARALWSGIHGICLQALTVKYGRDSEYALEDLTGVLIEQYMANKA